MSGFSLSAITRLMKGGRGRVLFVDGGVVPCPRRGDTDFDACLECPDLRRVNEQGRLSIECAGARYLDDQSRALRDGI